MIGRRGFVGLIAASPVLLAAGAAQAQTAEIYAEGGVAMDGHDPVALFNDGAPAQGLAAHTVTWKGAEWRFSSAANADLFENDPQAYAPQYGGWCAYAVSRNYTAPTVPEAWSIVSGKLYLNFSLGVRRIWQRDIEGNITAANANWPGVLDG